MFGERRVKSIVCVFTLVASGAKKFNAVGVVPYSTTPWESTPVAQVARTEFFRYWKRSHLEAQNRQLWYQKWQNNQKPKQQKLLFQLQWRKFFDDRVIHNNSLNILPNNNKIIPGIAMFATLSNTPLWEASDTGAADVGFVPPPLPTVTAELLF